MDNLQLVAKGGAWVPSVTVYVDEKKKVVDVDATLRHVLLLQKHGAGGVVINGTTGDGHELRQGDKLALIDGVGKLKREGKINENFVLLTGIGTGDIIRAKQIVAAARQNGFHGILALPHKSKQFHFYEELARECENGEKLAMLLYHHPRLRKNYVVSPDDLAVLMKHNECVVGVKDSAPDGKLHAEWLALATSLAGRTPLLAIGEDFLVHEGLKAGATAAIAGTANTSKGIAALRQVFRHHLARNGRLATAAQKRLGRETQRLLDGPDGFRSEARKNRLMK